MVPELVFHFHTRRIGHDLSRLAVAALRYLMFDPGFLQRVVVIRRQSFDRGDLATDTPSS